MKASEAIKLIEELIAKNGDLEIRQYGYYGNFPVTDIGLWVEDKHDIMFLLEPGQFHSTYIEADRQELEILGQDHTTPENAL
jgi:hypothetical protein